jgi:hypothetical protein
LVARFKIPDGWSVQAFTFALDCTPGQQACVRRQFGGRRYARNWAVRTLKEDLDRYHATGQETPKPSLASLRMRWNRAKDTECLDRETGEAWWPEISKDELPRVFRTGDLRLIHAASCPFRYSSRTSCGVRYPSVEWRRVLL